MRNVMDTQNRRFEKVFGHKLTECDGTRGHIDQWLLEVESKNVGQEEGEEASDDSSASDSDSEDL